MMLQKMGGVFEAIILSETEGGSETIGISDSETELGKLQFSFFIYAR